MEMTPENHLSALCACEHSEEPYIQHAGHIMRDREERLSEAAKRIAELEQQLAEARHLAEARGLVIGDAEEELCKVGIRTESCHNNDWCYTVAGGVRELAQQLTAAQERAAKAVAACVALRAGLEKAEYIKMRGATYEDDAQCPWCKMHKQWLRHKVGCPVGDALFYTPRLPEESDG